MSVAIRQRSGRPARVHCAGVCRQPPGGAGAGGGAGGRRGLRGRGQLPARAQDAVPARRAAQRTAAVSSRRPAVMHYTILMSSYVL